MQQQTHSATWVLCVQKELTRNTTHFGRDVKTPTTNTLLAHSAAADTHLRTDVSQVQPVGHTTGARLATADSALCGSVNSRELTLLSLSLYGVLSSLRRQRAGPASVGFARSKTRGETLCRKFCRKLFHGVLTRLSYLDNAKARGA